MPLKVRALIMPALNSCGVEMASSVMPLGEVYWPVVTHSTEHIALARPGEFLMERLPVLDRAAHQHFVQHRRATRPDLLHERKVWQLEAGRVRRSQRRNDGVCVRTAAAHGDVAHGEGQRPLE